MAQSPWGTGSLVLKVLGANPGTVPAAAPGLPPSKAPASAQPLLSPIAAQIVAANDRLLGIQAPDFAQLTAVTPSAPAPPQRTQPPLKAPPAHAAGITFTGASTAGEKKPFLNALAQALQAVGADQVKITSGFRTPAHNAAVGGVQGSLHTRGLAVDGFARINGQWVPLGVALKPVAGRYGLRSGDVPGFFNGHTDPVHVDYGYA